MEKTLRVKLFGESFKVHKIKIDSNLFPMFQKTADKLKEPLPLALLNAEYFKSLNMKNFQSLNDIIAYTFKGLLNNYRNQVEITLGRKKILKLKIDDLLRPQTLFPLFNVQIDTIDASNLSTGIYIKEREIGNIGTYEIQIESFQLNALKFYLTKVTMFNTTNELLNKIAYNNHYLPQVNTDALLTYQNSFIQE